MTTIQLVFILAVLFVVIGASAMVLRHGRYMNRHNAALEGSVKTERRKITPWVDTPRPDTGDGHAVFFDVTSSSEEERKQLEKELSMHIRGTDRRVTRTQQRLVDGLKYFRTPDGRTGYDRRLHDRRGNPKVAILDPDFRLRLQDAPDGN